ncbi:MAG: hypothetical protein R2746_13090 [Acidimicrobiales bacterium]
MSPQPVTPSACRSRSTEAYVLLDLRRPHLARQPAHDGAAVVRGRLARRQPGLIDPMDPLASSRCSRPWWAWATREIEVGSLGEPDLD